MEVWILGIPFLWATRLKPASAEAVLGGWAFGFERHGVGAGGASDHNQNGSARDNCVFVEGIFWIVRTGVIFRRCLGISVFWQSMENLVADLRDNVR